MVVNYQEKGRIGLGKRRRKSGNVTQSKGMLFECDVTGNETVSPADKMTQTITLVPILIYTLG